MKKVVFLLLFCAFKCYGQRMHEDSIIKRWSKAVINVASYTERDKNELILLDSLYEKGIVGKDYYDYSLQVLRSRLIRGTAIWLEYQNHNFLLSARHVFEDKTINVGACFNSILIVQDSASKSIDYSLFERLPKRHFRFEIGAPLDVIQVQCEKVYKFSSEDDDIGIINIDSSYYSYGVLKLLRQRKYEPITVEFIDTIFKVKKNDAVIAIGFPNESLVRIKDTLELPNSFNLASSVIVTLPIISRGNVFNVPETGNSFEININTYHGYSGGPIIDKKGKLIGITHGFRRPTITKPWEHGSYYLFQSNFKKSSLIMPLLRELMLQIKN